MKIHYGVRKIFLIAAAIVLTAIAAGCKQGADAKKEAQGAAVPRPYSPRSLQQLYLKSKCTTEKRQTFKALFRLPAFPIR